MKPNLERKRILSGVQPSGKLHIGNYFGAVKQHIALQDEGDCFYFIADYHALTTIQDAAKLRENTRDVALDYLALGLDPGNGVPRVGRVPGPLRSREGGHSRGPSLRSRSGRA